MDVIEEDLTHGAIISKSSLHRTDLGCAWISGAVIRTRLLTSDRVELRL